MGIEVMKTAMFSLMVHRVDIIRLRNGPDHLYLQTNLPNPVWPFTGTLAIRLAVTRGSARQWIRENLKTPNLEVTEADLETLPNGPEKPRGGAPETPFGTGGTVASVERPAALKRTVLTLRK